MQLYEKKKNENHERYIYNVCQCLYATYVWYRRSRKERKRKSGKEFVSSLQVKFAIFRINMFISEWITAAAENISIVNVNTIKTTFSCSLPRQFSHHSLSNCAQSSEFSVFLRFFFNCMHGHFVARHLSHIMNVFSRRNRMSWHISKFLNSWQTNNSIPFCLF